MHTREEILISFLELSSRPNSCPVFELEPFMWYRKKEEATHIAKACGVEAEFQALAGYIHYDDMQSVQSFLGVTDHCMTQLFEENVRLPRA